ncbi:hypothetical protein CARUB_v10007798mg [Capsella rubella]|uniref:DUF577 domain-containing protein n=1 Tax=Capsella rubella TaxID=81985 RepID=R0GQG4_9BRAS|nr:uncharacterized protein LOC17879169 [Capsella rubella]EOA19129.1 hypothetical protein CARUB_v10007798mg [Capsella rubella]
MEEEESLNLRSKAKDLLTNPSHEGAELLVEQISMPKETNECKTALTLFYFCVANFPNCVALKLLHVYRRSSNGVNRFRSIYLLSETLAEFKNRDFKFSSVALREIKPLVIECLTMQETKESDMKFLRRIVSLVTYNVLICDNGGWHELSDCILWLASTEPAKAFHVFVDLPSVYGTFIDKFMNIIVDEAKKVLLNPVKSEVENWSLALETVVKMGIQLWDMRYVEVLDNLLSIIGKSVKELVEKGMEQFLVRGLEHLERFLTRDKSLYSYNKGQCHVVMAFMMEIKDFGAQTKEIISKINRLVQTQGKPARKHSSSIVQLQDSLDHREEFDRGWLDHLKTVSSLEVLKIFASTDIEDRTREFAIRQLNVILSDHTSMRVDIDFSVMKELQPLLISCLRQEGITDSMFKVLGEVVSHVAYELFKHQDVTWYALRNYIASSKTEFQRAVYVLQCLTMPLEDEEFVIPVIEFLLPEISRRLDPPTELLVDNSCWVLAFTGAFFAAIHLIKVSGHAKSVKEIAHKMIDSVRKLVEREMEVGVVRRAFRDVESIVKKQMRWYGKSEYKLIKGLLWRLYTIKGMKWETKIVLWRINVIVERRVDEMVKELPDNEFDWLNLPEA